MDIRRRMMMSKVVSSGGSGGTSGINIDDYLTIEALENGLIASLSTNGFEYCIDGDGNWKTVAANVSTESINAGQTMSLRCSNPTIVATTGIGTFTISKKCNLKGNCMSMLFGDAGKDNFSLSGKNYCFYGLFKSSTTIQSVSSGFLPATTLSNNCYYSMFNSCPSLTTAPALPATTLSNSCYYYMFAGCTSLTTAPDLPALTLVSYCYRYMFYGCSKLNYIKAMFTTTPSSSYTGNWVSGVASKGTFVKNKDATWNVTGANGVQYGWTVIKE